MGSLRSRSCALIEGRSTSQIQLLAGGGIQKWGFDGAQGALATTLNRGLSRGVRGLAGAVTSSGVTLVATTTESSGNTW